MSKKVWIWVIIAVIVIGGAAFWGGMTYAQSKTSTTRSAGAAGATAFAGRTGAGGGFGGGAAGGATVGTIVQVSNGTFTVQLPSSTSSTATTGTKLVLIQDSTQIQELESVPASNLQNGQTVTVTGISNSDGSMTASNVMIRPATAGRTGQTNTQ